MRSVFSPRALFGYALAAFLFWWFLRRAEWRVLVTGFQSIGWWLLASAILVRFAALLAASLRWQWLLSPIKRVPLSSLVVATMMGSAIAAVGSMQAAEVVRPLVLSRRQGLSFASTFATVTVEWFLDILAVLSLVVPALWLIGRAPVNLTLALSFAIAVGGLLFLRFLPMRLARRSSGRFTTHIQSFADGLRILERPSGAVVLALYSLLIAMLIAACCWLALIAFGLPVSLVSGALLLGLVTIGGMMPTPGALGGFHAVCQWGLVTWFKLDPARAVLPVIGLHAVLYIPPAAVGAFCYFGAGLSAPRDAE